MIDPSVIDPSVPQCCVLNCDQQQVSVAGLLICTILSWLESLRSEQTAAPSGGKTHLIRPLVALSISHSSCSSKPGRGRSAIVTDLLPKATVIILQTFCIQGDGPRPRPDNGREAGSSTRSRYWSSLKTGSSPWWKFGSVCKSRVSSVLFWRGRSYSCLSCDLLPTDGALCSAARKLRICKWCRIEQPRAF